jgi:L-threonylcarbamoyladenylate synthase
MAFGLSPSSPRPQWLSGREEVAVRIPAHAFLLALMRDTGMLMVTSANRHGEPTSPSPGEAGSHVAPYVALVIDAGTLTAVPSTLVNVRGPNAVVEREGAISREAIATALERSA